MKLHEVAEAYKTDLNVQEAWELLNKHCKDALKEINRPIVRGMTNIDSGFGIIHGEAGGRRSRNTTNHYTVILDAVLPKAFPKRSKSIICANWYGLNHADNYGTLYAIIPFDGVKIGVCPYMDMWDTEITLGGETGSIPGWNYWLKKVGVTENMSFEEMVKKLEEDDNPEYAWLTKIRDNVRDELAEAYSEPFRLATTADSDVYNDEGDAREVWIGGKCVAINMKIYSTMMTDTEDVPHEYLDDKAREAWQKRRGL